MVGRTASFISPFYSLLPGLKLIETALHIKVKGVDPNINVPKYNWESFKII